MAKLTAKDVAGWQSALIQRGYDLGPSGADGDAGPLTLAAVRKFQGAAGLTPDGIVGPKTLYALESSVVVDHTRTLISEDLAYVGAGLVVSASDGALSAAAGKPPGPLVRDPPWLVEARRNLGVLEKVGAGSDPRVLKYFADAGFPGIKDDATAWCAAFVGAMLTRAGYAASGSLAARSYEGWGRKLTGPALGAVATKRRSGSPWQGHTFFIVGISKDGKIIYGLGGNQSDAVTVASFKADEIVGSYWPKEAKAPAPIFEGLPTTIAGAKASVKEA